MIKYPSSRMDHLHAEHLWSIGGNIFSMSFRFKNFNCTTWSVDLGASIGTAWQQKSVDIYSIWCLISNCTEANDKFYTVSTVNTIVGLTDCSLNVHNSVMLFSIHMTPRTDGVLGTEWTCCPFLQCQYQQGPCFMSQITVPASLLSISISPETKSIQYKTFRHGLINMDQSFFHKGTNTNFQVPTWPKKTCVHVSFNCIVSYIVLVKRFTILPSGKASHHQPDWSGNDSPTMHLLHGDYSFTYIHSCL